VAPGHGSPDYRVTGFNRVGSGRVGSGPFSGQRFLCLDLLVVPVFGRKLLTTVAQNTRRYYVGAVWVCASSQLVSTSASDWLERIVSEMTCNVLMRTLNPTHSLTPVGLGLRINWCGIPLLSSSSDPFPAPQHDRERFANPWHGLFSIAVAAIWDMKLES